VLITVCMLVSVDSTLGYSPMVEPFLTVIDISVTYEQLSGRE